MAASRPFRVVFMGSPEFAVPVFEAVAEAHQVIAAVTQPDRPAGRGRSLRPPPVKVAAEARAVPVIQPRAVRTRSFRDRLSDLGADLFVVAAYGRILPEPLLEVPPLGAYNVHGSLLPAWRGAAPIQWSLLSGDAETGVTIMRMDAGMDTGDIALQRRTPIHDADTAGSLSERLATLGAEAMLEALARLADGRLDCVAQDHARASAAPPLRKADGRLDFSASARAVSCRARGVDPWPGAHATLARHGGSLTVKLFEPRVLPPGAAPPDASPEQATGPGSVLGLDEHGVAVRCGQGVVSFAAVQLPGRRRIAARDAFAGRALRAGQRFE